MKKILLPILLASTLAMPLRAQSAQNILVVDVVNVLNNFVEAQAAQLKFNSAVEEMNKTLTEKAQAGLEIQKQAQDLQSQSTSPTLTPDARDVYKKQLQDKIGDLQKADSEITNMRTQAQQILQQRQQSIIAEEVGKIRTAVLQIAKKHNSNLVLNSAGVNAVVISDPNVDITKEVIDLLNAGASPLPSTATSGNGALSGAAPSNSMSGPAPLSMPSLGTAKPAGTSR